MYKGELVNRKKSLEEPVAERPLKTYKEYLEANKLNKKYGKLSAIIKTKKVSKEKEN